MLEKIAFLLKKPFGSFYNFGAFGDPKVAFSLYLEVQTWGVRVVSSRSSIINVVKFGSYFDARLVALLKYL